MAINYFNTVFSNSHYTQNDLIDQKFKILEIQMKSWGCLGSNQTRQALAKKKSQGTFYNRNSRLLSNSVSIFSAFASISANFV
jgi:hypothetical protein